MSSLLKTSTEKKVKKKIPIVKVEGVKKHYRIGQEVVKALDGVDLEIYKGEFVVILGTSGSGKSTLLNMLAGLEKPTTGTITILGQNISKMRESRLAKFRQSHVGFIFQSYNLLPMYTAIENVALPLTFKRVKKLPRLKEAAKLLKAVDLSTHMLHKPTQMSGGQQQRVGIARAFAGVPEIVFADEPTGNLDTKTSDSVLKLMLDLARKNKQTIIMVSHDPSIGERGDKVVRILDGKIIEIVENKKTS